MQEASSVLEQLEQVVLWVRIGSYRKDSWTVMKGQQQEVLAEEKDYSLLTEPMLVLAERKDSCS